MKRVVAGTILAAFLTGCANGTEKLEEAAVPNVPQDVTIVSIGDSLTEGIGDITGSGGYVPYLEKQLESLREVDEASFVNYGKKGNRTDQLLKRLETESIQTAVRKADFVIVTIGGNDVVKVIKENWSDLTIENFQAEEKNYTERIHQVMTSIRSINEDAGIVLVGLYNPFGRVFIDTDDDEEIVRAWNKRAEEVVSSFDRAVFVNIESTFGEGSDNLFYEDQFHPNNLGYEQMAKRIFSTIKGETLEQLTNNKIIWENEGSN